MLIYCGRLLCKVHIIEGPHVLYNSFYFLCAWIVDVLFLEPFQGEVLVSIRCKLANIYGFQYDKISSIMLFKMVSNR